jgi:hypothetical protein
MQQKVKKDQRRSGLWPERATLATSCTASKGVEQSRPDLVSFRNDIMIAKDQLVGGEAGQASCVKQRPSVYQYWRHR